MSTLTRRTQLLLDDARDERLEREARATGRSVAAIIRDARLEDAQRARRRRDAWQRLFDQPSPDYEREPDWVDVKDGLGSSRWDRMYPDLR